MRCLARGERRHGGRGEAAGDCAYAAESLRTAAETVCWESVPYGIQLSPGFKTLARFDGKLRTIGRRGKYYDYTLKAPGSPAKWEAEARWSFCYMGGDQRDRRNYPRVQSSGGGASPHYIAGDI